MFFLPPHHSFLLPFSHSFAVVGVHIYIIYCPFWLGGLGQLITSWPLPALSDPAPAVYVYTAVYYYIFYIIIIFVFPLSPSSRRLCRRFCCTIPFCRDCSALKNVSTKKYINKYTVYIIYIYIRSEFDIMPVIIAYPRHGGGGEGCNI